MTGDSSVSLQQDPMTQMSRYDRDDVPGHSRRHWCGVG